MPGIHCVALPPRFHSALLDLAEERWGWGVAAHGPYGAPLPPPMPSGWHNTSDYALEPLFHARAQRSHEPDAAAATAVYAPYYAGLALRLLGPARAAALEAELLETLAQSSAWVRGRPHADPNPNPNHDPNANRDRRPNPKSNPKPNPEPEPDPEPGQVRARPARRLLVLGLVANEFAQPREGGWGSTLLLRPELRGVSVATIEPRPGCNVVGSLGGVYGGTRVAPTPSRRVCWGEQGRLRVTPRLVGVP